MNHRYRRVTAPRVLVLFLVSALLAGCGLLGSRGSDADEERAVPGEVNPNSSGVYRDNTYLHVRLEPQDESQGAPNDHPVEISGQQVEASLKDLRVRAEEDDEIIPLIPERLLPELSVILAQALGDAQPDEDVVFDGFRKAGSFFGSERRATSARVFYRDGKLNLIFGELDDFYSEQIDRDLNPLKPGYRNKVSELSGSVVASPQVAFVDNRPDWIRLDLAAAIATESAAPTAAVAAPAPAAAPVETTRDPRWTQLEERLLILDGLREKGLITEEDYATKKQELLQVLDL